MKQMTVIYDINRIRNDFINRISLNYYIKHCVHGNRTGGNPHEMFYAWLLHNLENMFCIVPTIDTASRAKSEYLSYIDNSFDMLSVLLYQQIRIPRFTGDYRFTMLIISDDLFLIFN